MVVGIGDVGYRRQATGVIPARYRRSLRRVEDVLAVNAFEIDQVVEARLVDVQRVNLPSAHAAAARPPADAELSAVRPQAEIGRPLGRLERLELLDLLRNLQVGWVGLRQGEV